MVKRNRSHNSNILNDIFSFPDEVNEYAARIVAGFVVILTTLFLITENIWILVFLAYGFWARVLTGPTLSPLAQLTLKGIIPLLGSPTEYCPGPPKRFAQSVGAGFTSTALILVVSGNIPGAQAFLGVLVVFSSLESVVGFCAGCWFFKYLMVWGVIPQKICLKCQNIEFVNR